MVVMPREGQVLLATAEDPEGSPVALPEQEVHLKSASAHFLWGIETGEEFMALCSAGIGRDGQAVLEAGLQSSKSDAVATAVG